MFFTIYQQIENYWIAPSVMKSSVDVPPLATIVGALLGGALLGVLGALLGIPLVAAILLILREVVFPVRNGPDRRGYGVLPSLSVHRLPWLRRRTTAGAITDEYSPQK
ncbi:AI-2E family transporter [Streptosporangium lutulentum]